MTRRLSKGKEAEALIKILSDDGWYFHSQKGSHRFYKHPTKKGKITVPYRISKNVELSVLRQAGLRDTTK